MKFLSLKFSLTLAWLLAAAFVVFASTDAWGRLYGGARNSRRQPATPVAQAKAAKTPTVQAVLFGVDNYRGGSADGRGSTLGNLRGCVNDVEATRAWLKETGVQDATIQTLSDSAQAPTAANFRQALSDAANRDCDRLIVVVACHGLSFNGKSYVCPKDARPNVVDGALQLSGRDANAYAADAKAQNLIAVDDILRALQNAKAPEVLLILDACRNNDGESFMREFSDLAKNKSVDSVFRKVKTGAFAVITSCSYGERAEEINDRDAKPRGAFSYYFLEGLAGRADELGCYDGKITLVEAYNYAYARTSSDAKKRGRKQTPEIFVSSAGGNMYLAEINDDDLKTAAYEDLARMNDARFLLRTGRIFCRGDNTTTYETGVKALNYALTYLPNNEPALAARGSANRRLGDYEAALADMKTLGQELQLHGAVDVKNDATGETLNFKNALLTIENVDGERLYVTEVDNAPLSQPVWMSKELATWNKDFAAERIPETRLQRARSHGIYNEQRPALGSSLDPRNPVYNSNTGIIPGSPSGIM